MARDLLLEIGAEELPSSFVAGALAALPGLIREELASLRLGHGEVWVGGTPRRLALIVQGVDEAQADLDEEVLGPPARVAFDADGKLTRAGEAFASKLGVEVSALTRQETPKGEYLAARRVAKGEAATALLPEALARVAGRIPFRKSMRWSDGDTEFGRPVRWLVALFGEEQLPVVFAGIRAGRVSAGHRFLGREVQVERPSAYVASLAAEHVLVDTDARRALMLSRLHEAAASIGGSLIEDAFLVGENLSLVEEPQVLVGSFDAAFLALPERVVLDVAKDHQRYFGVRDPSGALLPRYLLVANTAERPENILRGNDRVMRARLSDAKFFYDEDMKRELASRREALDQVVFHKRLGSVGDKVRRIERLTRALGAALTVDGAVLDAAVIESAARGAGLAKCDLVTLMVGEFPELQGEIGTAYAVAQGVPREAARVIAEHYQPRGADDALPASVQGALVALADRLDTLVGCFAVGLAPTGAADPLALRRATIGCLKILIGHQFHADLSELLSAAYQGYLAPQGERGEGVALDLSIEDARARLLDFFRDRLRGVLAERYAGDVVEAVLAAHASSPLDAERRAAALAALDGAARATVGEVFKRAANIAKQAPPGAAVDPSQFGAVPPEEQALYQAFVALQAQLAAASKDYPRALQAIVDFAPTLAAYFEAVFVMVDDVPLRENRLRLMRDIEQSCGRVANFKLLAQG
ncbi:MAG: glycine--tRNA ligase subunit beta [Polyangiaceae bacterium]|nr:glycine--tRNA ligase subunit beta [Polyangiaceae bacterium]MCW5789211.1 glycine--tRNA ligase subunit beta [Polyangiaceae bacterium]